MTTCALHTDVSTLTKGIVHTAASDGAKIVVKYWSTDQVRGLPFSRMESVRGGLYTQARMETLTTQGVVTPK